MDNPRASILIVDDEKDSVEALQHFLSRRGYEVSSAYNAEEALDILGAKKTDAAIVDIVLPGIQGSELAKAIRDKCPNIKILVVTGNLHIGSQLAQDTSLDGMFFKPVKIEFLYDRLAEVLNPGGRGALKGQEGINARLILTRAKLLFLENQPDVYAFLKSHFQSLASKGGNYEIDLARDEAEAINKLDIFKPDILLINQALCQGGSGNNFNGLKEQLGLDRIIVYNLSLPIGLSSWETIAKTVQMSCLRNGLLEVKWVTI